MNMILGLIILNGKGKKKQQINTKVNTQFYGTMSIGTLLQEISV